MTLGQKVRKARGKASSVGYSRELGVSAQFLNNVEKDRRRPSIDALSRWVDLTGIPARDFYPEAASLFK